MQLYLCIYLFLHSSIYIFCLTIFQPWMFFKVLVSALLRTLGRAVDKLLNGSRVTSHGQFIFGKQSLSLFRGNTAFQQNRRSNFSHFLNIVETGLFFTFFGKSELLTMKNRGLNIPFGLNEIYAVWTVHFRRRKFYY